MANISTDRITRDRIILTLIGALAGLAGWGLIDVLPDRIENERVLLFLVTATGGFFAAFLAATGPLPFHRAALAAALAAVPAAALLTWASGRFASVDDFLETLHPAVAFGVIVVISLPFLIAGQRPGEGWRAYPALFTQSWNIVVRYAAAWLFVGAFWAVVFLSDTLFGLVGLTIIEDLLDIDPVPYILSGAVLGLAMAVVVELSDYVSPFLILRLLRLLVPVVLVVVAVFLVALPFRGLSELFGGLSAAATLMAMAIGMVTLISSALDRSDDEAADSGIMRGSVQLMALGLPVLAGLAIYAIWLRVADYGLSPDRIAAATAALIVLGYAVFYALAVVARRNWRARIRGANIAMALALVGIGAIWLTPLLDAQKISARDQVARFVAGKTDLDKLDLWFLDRELGYAGKAAVAALATLEHPQSEALRAQIARLKEAKSRYAFTNAQAGNDARSLIEKITASIAVRPAGAALPAQAFANAATRDLRRWAEGCARRTPAGNPGCVLLRAELLAARRGDEMLLFWMNSDSRATLRVIWPGPDPAPPDNAPIFLTGSRSADITPAALDAIYDGGFGLGPASVPALTIGGAEIMLQP